jgi:hypothetical protein
LLTLSLGFGCLLAATHIVNLRIRFVLLYGLIRLASHSAPGYTTANKHGYQSIVKVSLRYFFLLLTWHSRVRVIEVVVLAEFQNALIFTFFQLEVKEILEDKDLQQIKQQYSIA